jgi:hypothetical protein
MMGYLNKANEEQEICKQVWSLMGCKERMTKHKLRVVLYAI